MRRTTRRGGAHVRRDTDRFTDDHDRLADETVVDTRDRFGGIDLPAAFAGTMASLGMLALLGAIASGWNSYYGEELARGDVVSITGVAVALAIIVLSCMFGGWVAGRTARYNGAGNGFLTGFLLVLLAVGLGWLAGSVTLEGADFTVPTWITDDATTSTAVVTAAVAAGVALLSAALGGALGSLWHRRVDRSLVLETENNAFAPYPEEQRLVTPPPSYDEDKEIDLDEQPATRRTPARTARGRRAD